MNIFIIKFVIEVLICHRNTFHWIRQTIPSEIYFGFSISIFIKSDIGYNHDRFGRVY